MAEVVRTYGEDKIKETKEDVDTLLVFVSTPPVHCSGN